jgi:hypothetical protein
MLPGTVVVAVAVTAIVAVMGVIVDGSSWLVVVLLIRQCITGSPYELSSHLLAEFTVDETGS